MVHWPTRHANSGPLVAALGSGGGPLVAHRRCAIWGLGYALMHFIIVAVNLHSNVRDHIEEKVHN